jgi:hypothetical protein
MKRAELQFVVCIKKLRLRSFIGAAKAYRVLPDSAAVQLGQLRVIDESGEDYLYPQEYFVPIQLPQSAEKAISRAV